MKSVNPVEEYAYWRLLQQNYLIYLIGLILKA